MWKFTLINLIVGLVIAATLSMLLVLGLRIFIPAPEYPRYDYSKCNNNDLNLRNDCMERFNRDIQAKQATYQEDYKEYSGKIFIASNIVGLVVLLIGILVFAIGWGVNIGIGILLAGAFGITFGYVLGWQGADDGIKFIIGLVVAIIVISGGVVINKMRDSGSISS